MRPSDEEGEYDNSMFGAVCRQSDAGAPGPVKALLSPQQIDEEPCVAGGGPVLPSLLTKERPWVVPPHRPEQDPHSDPHSARHPHSEQGQGETKSEGERFEGKNANAKMFWPKSKELLYFVPQLSVLCEFIIQRNKQNHNKIHFCV